MQTIRRETFRSTCQAYQFVYAIKNWQKCAETAIAPPQAQPALGWGSGQETIHVRQQSTRLEASPDCHLLGQNAARAEIMLLSVWPLAMHCGTDQWLFALVTVVIVALKLGPARSLFWPSMPG